MSCDYTEGVDYILSVVLDAVRPHGWPLLFQDTASDPDRGGSAPSAPVWLRATIRHGDGFQSSLTGPLEAKKRHTQEGVVIIQIFAESGDGGKAAYDAAQIVSTALKKSRDIPVWFRRVRINNVDSKGPYDQINVLADFSYDDVR